MVSVWSIAGIHNKRAPSATTIDRPISHEKSNQFYGLCNSLSLSVLFTATAVHFGLESNAGQFLLLSAPPLVKSADIMSTLSYPMTRTKAASTNLAKIFACALIPGAQLLPRLIDRQRRTDNYRPAWRNGPKA